jgi:hypothetical protein
MVNQSAIQQLAREYRRESLAAAQAHGLAARLTQHAFRDRVGWSLVGLGMRLTKDPFAGTAGQGRHARAAQAVARPGAPRARASLPLARL